MKKDSLNLIFLTIIQVSNAILPLVVFPYVLDVMGEESYSEIVITESIMFIIYAFVLYSFEINGVTDVIKSEGEENVNKLSELFNKVLMIRLLIFGFFMFVVLILLIILKSSFLLLLMAWLLFPLSYILQSSYFFLALEDNFFLAFSVIMSRGLAVFCIFYFVDKSDYSFIVPLTIGFSFLLGGLSSFIYALIKFNLNLKLISLGEIKKTIYIGKEIFFGNISVLMFKDINVIIIGLLTNNPMAISSYSIAEKILKSFQAGIRPLNSFFFPKGIRLLKNETLPNKRVFSIITKLTIPQWIVLTIFVLGFFIIACNFGESIIILKKIPNLGLILGLCSIMIFSVFLGVSNFMYGTVGLNHLQCEGYYAKSIFLTGIISLVFSIVMISLFYETGAAISFVAGEAILLFFILRKYFKNTEGNNKIASH